MSRSRSSVPGIDAELVAKDTAKLLPEPTRRAFLRAGAGVGALAFLTGCNIIDGPSVENALRIVSRFNDRVQAWLFNPNRLAPTYPETAITRPFPFNAYYREENAPDIDEYDYKLLIDGLVDDKRSWTLDRLYSLPQETQITRLVCVEGWSAIGKWTGTPLREFLCRIGADTRAKYVHFTCADGYSSSIDMATALHPQTQMTFKYDGEILPPKYGFPMRVRIPTKLGFKNPKHVIGLVVLNNYTGGYWEDQGYNWFSGL
jgi:DMSO/TMAO reductase YedYZ molybdopterin-dependent catalytic subunit